MPHDWRLSGSSTGINGVESVTGVGDRCWSQPRLTSPVR
jgi:hypothetical protein